MVERLCNSFQDTPHGHATPNELALRFNLNTPLEQALIEPGALIGRTPMDWSARFVMQSSVFASFWCRSVSYYADWPSHLPELQLLEQEDLVKLLVERGPQCLWLCFAHHSIKEGMLRHVMALLHYGRPLSLVLTQLSLVLAQLTLVLAQSSLVLNQLSLVLTQLSLVLTQLSLVLTQLSLVLTQLSLVLIQLSFVLTQ